MTLEWDIGCFSLCNYLHYYPNYLRSYELCRLQFIYHYALEPRTTVVHAPLCFTEFHLESCIYIYMTAHNQPIDSIRQ